MRPVRGFKGCTGDTNLTPCITRAVHSSQYECASMNMTCEATRAIRPMIIGYLRFQDLSAKYDMGGVAA